MNRRFRMPLCVALAASLAGCHHPSITAVSLNPVACHHPFAIFHDPCNEPKGIPFYLPKPLLIVSKNFRNIEETHVGLTDSAPIPNFFDDQAKYGDLNARTNFSGLDGNAATGSPASTSGNQQFPTGDAKNLASVSGARVYSGTGAPISPGTTPSDGLKPETFYTYHIIFVPDMTQKYGLRIKGGVGEIRAAMNLVNGWQFTGLGPYYMKDSSTAQNTLASGITANLAASGVADVVKAAATLRGAPGGATGTRSGPAPGAAPGAAEVPLDLQRAQAVVDMVQKLRPSFVPIPGYAEISIYEPFLSPEGTMEWKPIVEKQFTREVIGTSLTDKQLANVLGSIPELNFLKDAKSDPLPPPAPGGGAFVPSGGNTLAPPAPLAPAIGGPTSGLGTRPDMTVPAHIRSSRDAQVLPSANVPVRRTSIRNVLANDAKSDDAVMRTQAEAPATGGFTKVRLAPGTDTGTLGDWTTAHGNPAFEVSGATPNTKLMLYRDKKLVNQVSTGPTIADAILLPDNQAGPVTLGTHDYRIDVVGEMGDKATVSTPRIRIVAPTEQIEETESPPLQPGPGATSFQSALINRFLGHNEALGVAPTAKQIPAAALSAPPTAANQVNLNQYFGKTHVGSAPDSSTHHFSLFHRKEKKRPTIRTLDLDGLSAEAFAAAGPGGAALPVTTTPANLNAAVAGAGAGTFTPSGAAAETPTTGSPTAPAIGP